MGNKLLDSFKDGAICVAIQNLAFLKRKTFKVRTQYLCTFLITVFVVMSKVKTLFVKVVMMHIKLKGMEHRAPCKYTF